MKNVFKNEQGTAAIEFAICVSFLLLLFLGSVEISRYVLAVQKVEGLVGAAADITAQTQISPPLTEAQFETQETNLLNSSAYLMDPYGFTNNGTVIITDISMNNNVATINWQTCGGGTLGAKSKIGTVGSTPIMPAGYTLNSGEEIIIAEVFYNYSPMTIQNVVQQQTVYRISTFVPRNGSLTNFTVKCN